MKKRPYSDFLEEEVAKILDRRNIKFIHEHEINGKRLDFFLPDFDVYIEIKQYHTDRVVEQLKSADNVILIQGKKSLHFFKSIFSI